MGRCCAQAFRCGAFAAVVAGAPALALAQAVPALPVTLPPMPTQAAGGIIQQPQPAIVVGDPSLPGNPTAFGAINGNSPDSPLAGVVSVYGAISPTTGVEGSGVAIDPYHVLTAAHVVDFSGGLSPQGTATGDGTVDALMPYSRIYLNNTAAPDPFTISAIQVAPGWTGFNNVLAPGGPSDLNDLAILTLATPLPSSVPTYPIYRTPFEQDTAKVILMTGYGLAGDAVDGITQPASFETKRFGFNTTNTYQAGPDGHADVYLADFDPPDPLTGNGDPTHTGFDGLESLGNGLEATIGPGDSGGAAFIFNDLNNDGILEANELTLFGLTTFTFDTTDGSWPGFGSGFGGTILSAYAGFVDSAVPEPATAALVAAGLLLLPRRRTRRHIRQ